MDFQTADFLVFVFRLRFFWQLGFRQRIFLVGWVSDLGFFFDGWVFRLRIFSEWFFFVDVRVSNTRFFLWWYVTDS